MESTLIVLLIIGVYFLPSFVAAGRANNGGAIIVNIFLGWTLIGWVAALAWAASLDRVKPGATGAEAVASCPFCAEEIKPAAVVCKHCGRDLPGSA